MGQQGVKTEYELLLRETRAQVSQIASEKLASRYTESEILRGVVLTPELLKKGPSLILEASVENEGMCVVINGLQKTAGRSKIGDFHYVPVLFHEAEKVGGNHRALLELLGLIIGKIQGVDPVCGILINGQNCVSRRLRLHPERGPVRRILHSLAEIQAKGAAPRLVLNRHCPACEFRDHCRALAIEKDDLSLLRSMGEKEILKYNKRGIFNLTQLSCTFRPRKKSKRSKEPKASHHPALKALAIREKKIYILGSPTLPTSSTRIFLDVEGDPERGFDYLVGMIVETGGAEERFAFWANAPTDESQVFQQFLEVIQRYEDFRIYSYGSYDLTFLRRMFQASKQQELGESVLSRCMNILSIIHLHVYFPTFSNGLKEIGQFLEFNWTEPSASGLQSIVWRRRWEQTGSSAFMHLLKTYNMDDCAALKKVTEFVYAILPAQPRKSGDPEPNHEGRPVSRADDLAAPSSRREWCKADFAIPDFEFVNERAYFDYQRDKVFIRTNKALKKRLTKTEPKKGTKKHLRPNENVEINSTHCPFCKGTDLTRTADGRLVRLAYDLRFTKSGIRRWVTRFTTFWHHCTGCQKRFLPADYLRLAEHFHALKSWAMYEHITHRTSLANIAETIRECFTLPCVEQTTYGFKKELAQYYQDTYQRILEKLVTGALIHADETEVHLKKVGKGYVWIFTNLEEVVFMYRKSREGDFLHEMLEDFRGVLVSDFYSAYDSLTCPQQKCLIHLIRDFNQDIRGNPWDEELKGLASEFGVLLRSVVSTIDEHGLKHKHLCKHSRHVNRFFGSLVNRSYRSDVAESFRKRLLKCRDKLFTFLDHDNVPWNNNNAEYAAKKFAYYREYADGLIVETGLNDYLVLLSVCLTCKYKGVSFLKFLLSRETDIDVFCENRRKRHPSPTIQLLPEGSKSNRWSRENMSKKLKRETDATTGKDPGAKSEAGSS